MCSSLIIGAGSFQRQPSIFASFQKGWCQCMIRHSWFPCLHTWSDILDFLFFIHDQIFVISLSSYMIRHSWFHCLHTWSDIHDIIFCTANYDVFFIFLHLYFFVAAIFSFIIFATSSMNGIRKLYIHLLLTLNLYFRDCF